MTHPTINHIDDFLHHIAGRDEFIVADRDDYKVIDYNFALPDSFDDPVRIECRGLKFAPDGRILARPLHKFMNLGETESLQPHLLDFESPHTVTVKMDGSMIHACLIKGEVVFMTRMGHTDVAKKAERHLTPAMRRSCAELLSSGYTPIFEFTAPDNRIVIQYEESALTLLALRHTTTGNYNSADLALAAAMLNVPRVAEFDSEHSTGQGFADFARAVTGIEGFVVRFDSGLWVKAKGEDYVLKHRAKDSILQEKNVLALILRGELDDVIPLLDERDRKRVTDYEMDVSLGLARTAERVASHVRQGSNLDQKEFAVRHQAKIDSGLRPIAFSVRAGKKPTDAVASMIEKNLGSQTAVDAVRHLHGATLSV